MTSSSRLACSDISLCHCKHRQVRAGAGMPHGLMANPFSTPSAVGLWVRQGRRNLQHCCFLGGSDPCFAGAGYLNTSHIFFSYGSDSSGDGERGAFSALLNYLWSVCLLCSRVWKRVCKENEVLLQKEHYFCTADLVFGCSRTFNASKIQGVFLGLIESKQAAGRIILK